jgi:beta-glucosidase
LSYTHFAYGDLKVQPAADGSLTATLEVANTGAREGDDVVQLYATPPLSGQARELRALCGFARVSLKAGERRSVSITIPAIALRRWNGTQAAYGIATGEWTVSAGASSADLRQTAKVKL